MLELYQKMYATLCGASSDALDKLEANDLRGAAALLRWALEECEERYLSAEELPSPPCTP